MYHIHNFKFSLYNNFYNTNNFIAGLGNPVNVTILWKCKKVFDYFSGFVFRLFVAQPLQTLYNDWVTTGVNFINIKRARFSYKCFLAAFSCTYVCT